MTIMQQPIGTIISLPKILDPRGNLTVAEGDSLPFAIRRAFWVYDVPGGESRGSHAHKKLWQLVVAASGSFTVTLDDGERTEKHLLNHPWQGLLIKNNVWNTLEDFSSGAVSLCLASEEYDEADYIRDYDEFCAYVKSLKNR